MASIEFDGVTKRFADGTVAVDDLDVTITDGEFMIFVGPSGCGKTTALRMAAGLEEITSGTISLGGRAINDVEASERDIAMVFQNYALYPHMTVAANLGFPLRMRGTSRSTIKARVDEVAKLLDIGPLLERRPRELSGGQRQRVAMGRAIVRHPQAFLMDEPLSNLDAKLRVQMRAELVKLHQTLGVTTVYVTHDQTEAMTLGQRVTVMDHGIVQQVADPQDLYDWPANTFVASFIGSPPMNFVRGVLDGDGVRLGARVITLPSAITDGVGSRGLEVTVGLRPETFLLDDGNGDRDRDGETQAVFGGNVDIVERLGSESFVYFRDPEIDVLEIGERPLELAGTMCARIPAGVRYQPGSHIGFSADSSMVRLFDKDSGTALSVIGR